MHAKNKLHHFLFLRYYILKNPVIWLAGSILAHNLRPKILPDVGEISIAIILFILDYF